MRRQHAGWLATGALATALIFGGAGVATVWAQTGPGSGRAMTTATCPHGGPGMMQGGGLHMQMPADMTRHFIEEMIPHHEDAIAMADLALAQAEHPELQQLAATIKQVQAAEIEQMRQWYQAWYGTEVPASTMAGYRPGMAHMDPGAIDGAQPFDKAFIEAMIPHHQMAVHMATMTLQTADRPEVRQLLQAIIDGQSAEISQMQEWYRAWYGEAVPGGRGMMGGPGHHGRAGMGWGHGMMPGQGSMERGPAGR